MLQVTIKKNGPNIQPSIAQLSTQVLNFVQYSIYVHVISRFRFVLLNCIGLTALYTLVFGGLDTLIESVSITQTCMQLTIPFPKLVTCCHMQYCLYILYHTDIASVSPCQPLFILTKGHMV